MPITCGNCGEEFQGTHQLEVRTTEQGTVQVCPSCGDPWDEYSIS
jgi:DNA-directed RNA polymerase subunit M/transcription elongation factor TFIIS